MTWQERILADSADRPTWLHARGGVLGASDVAGFAKIESVPKYTLAKLKSGKFKGNHWTESGNTWEPRILAQLGIPRNTLFVHAEGETGFAATPDGVEILPTGEIVLSEVKAIHDRIVYGPTPAFRRQIWWAQYCWGATRTKFIWHELVNGVPRRLEPHIQIIDRDDTEIAKLLAIARPVLAAVRAARQFYSEMEQAA